LPYPFRNAPPPAPARQGVGGGAISACGRSDLLPRPAHGHLLGLRRRQVGAAVDDGSLCRGRRLGHWPCRRARCGRCRSSRRMTSGQIGYAAPSCINLDQPAPDAPPGRLPRACYRGVFP
jgi:hypothetical protein